MPKCNFSSNVGVGIVVGCLSCLEVDVADKSSATVEVLADISAHSLLEEKGATWMLVTVA